MRAFSLVEILITVALFTILIGLGLFMSMETFRGVGQRSEQEVIVSLLEKARSRAMNNIQQSPWGVCAQAGVYAVFKGTTCNTLGDTFPANPNATTAGLISGVVFTQLSGTTTPTVITLTQNSRTSTITIPYEGTLIW